MSGWIKLHRSLKDWEWYDDDNALRLLIHLLISVNYEDKKWRGIIVKSGSMVLSWETLSLGCGMSVRKCRTAMNKLEISKEVTRSVTNRFQLVSLVKWEELQSDDRQATAELTDKRQTDDRQMTTTKETNNKKNNKETIPDFQDFKIYALEKKPDVNLEALKLKYDSWVENGWKTGGSKSRAIKNWKSSLLNTLPWLKEKSSAKKENNKKDAAQILSEKYGISQT